MNIDLKNNVYLLSLITGVVVAVINLVVDKLTQKDDKEPINYMNYVKVGGIVCLVVLGTNMILKSEPKNLVGGSGNVTPQVNTSNPVIESTEVKGLEEVNMNQKIHTGNPHF